MPLASFLTSSSFPTRLRRSWFCEYSPAGGLVPLFPNHILLRVTRIQQTDKTEDEPISAKVPLSPYVPSWKRHCDLPRSYSVILSSYFVQHQNSYLLLCPRHSSRLHPLYRLYGVGRGPIGCHISFP